MRLRATRSAAVAQGAYSVPLDVDAAAYIAAVSSAGGTIAAPQQQAFSTFVATLKTASIWSKLLDVGTFSGGTLASAAVKLKSANGLSCVLNNFVLGDLTSKGLKSTTTTKYANTRVPVSALPGTGFCGLGVFLTEESAPTDFGTMIGASRGGNPQLCMSWYGSGDSEGTVDALLNGSGANPGRSKHPLKRLPLGLLHAERGGNAVRFFEGGILVDNNSSTFTPASSSDTIGVLGHGNGDLAMPGTVGLYFVTNGSVSDAEAKVLAKACNTLIVGLGRVVPDARPFNFVPLIGQSLAQGAMGTPVLSTTQTYKNLVPSTVRQSNPADNFATYLAGLSGNGAHIGTPTPMVEFGEETIASGAANTVAQYARAATLGAAHDVYSQNFGVGGTAYSGLAKGTNPYQNGISSAGQLDAPAILHATGALRAPAVWAVHGESDMNSLTYQADIRQWQVDYETDLKAVTGQSGTIPMLHSQPSCWTHPNNTNSATGRSPYAIAAEAKLNPTKTLLVGPKYFLTYTANDIHLTNSGYRLFGEYYGKAHFQHVVQGTQWTPLRPLSVTRTNAVIDVVFEGCVGNLVIDTTAVTDPSGASNTKGFEYRDDTIGDGAQRYTSISSVAILTQTPPTIRVTLASNPGAASNKRLRFAYTGTAGANPGPTTGPRGCVRDSDTRVGPSATALVNWCIHFDEAVA